jgi:hypothetical protein
LAGDQRRAGGIWVARARVGPYAVAECPNVNLKLGGIGMPRLGFDWHTRARPIGSEANLTSTSANMRRPFQDP